MTPRLAKALTVNNQIILFDFDGRPDSRHTNLLALTVISEPMFDGLD